MIQIRNRILSLLPAAVMVVGLSQAGSFLNILSLRASAATYSGACGTNGGNVTWSLVTDTGVLTISGTGSMRDYYVSDYEPIGDTPWFSYRTYINTVIIDSGVTKMGECAFARLENLTSVLIPDTITKIRCCAFTGCTGLTNITIPDSVTQIGDSAFEKCPYSTDVTIPDGVKYVSDDDFFAVPT